MLGTLGSMDAVPALIEALNSKHIMVQLSAHGALNKLTGKNFGYKNYQEWKSWYESNKKDIQERKVQGAGEMRKVNAKYNNTLGIESLHHGEYATARGYFLKAVNMDPEVPDYRNNLGLSVMELGSYVDAINYFEEALGIDNELPQPYMNIGSCFARMNKTIEAQHWFRKAVEKDKKGDLWETCWSLGKEYLKKGDFQMAQEFLELARDKAAKNRIYDPRIYRDLAQTYYGLDQYHTAWMTILFVRQMNYDLNEDFVEKVRKQLVTQGIDPDKLDPSANPVSLTGDQTPTPQTQSNAEANPRTAPSDSGAPKKHGLKLNAETEK
jgi:tetratricopeptide (TPR) repeat protein